MTKHGISSAVFMSAALLCVGAITAANQAHDGQTSSNVATVTVKTPQIYQDWPYSAQEAARRQNETAVALGIPREISLNLAKGVPIKFVLIPAGRFWMGTPYSTTFQHWAGEIMHEVTISKPFYLGVNHVTQLQWLTIEGTTVAQQYALGNTTSWSGRQLVGVGDDYPMYYVNWYEATNFCQKVSTHTSMAVRLPTDSQWEYAAQAGSAEMFFWGKNVPSVLSEYVWGSWNTGRITTQPEGLLKPNPFGLYDIDGNVWSWCADWSSPTHGNAGSMPAGPVTDPTGWPSPNAIKSKVARGGAFVSGWGGMRTADAAGGGGTPADRRFDAKGFRVAMDIPSASAASKAPFLVAAPTKQTVNVGQSVTFHVAAKGAAPLSYQWMKNGVKIPGATDASYTKSTVLAEEYGATFAVAVSNTYGQVISGNATLTVNNLPPVITLPPVNQSVSVGGSATFRVTATSNVAPLTYQWTRNGVNIASAKSASFTTPPATAGDNGTIFAVVVSNSLGGTVSSGGVLTVGTIRHICFQPDTSTLPAGYERDNGSVYDASRGWGWNVALRATDRGNTNADPRLNTYVSSRAAATWRCDLPNGNYSINMSCGDARAISGPQWVLVQGKVAIQVGGWEGGGQGSSISTPVNYFESATHFPAKVTDGQLNVVIANGTSTTTLNYIDIIPVPSGEAPAAAPQPAGQTANRGKPATFKGMATGTPPRIAIP